jgi:hypothetical protein
MTMTDLPVVDVGGVHGLMFECAEHGCFCFVPLACLDEEAGGQWSLNEAAYVCSSWHQRNCAFNVHARGRSLFPRRDGLVLNLEASGVREYLGRLQRSCADRTRCQSS